MRSDYLTTHAPLLPHNHARHCMRVVFGVLAALRARV